VPKSEAAKTFLAALFLIRFFIKFKIEHQVTSLNHFEIHSKLIFSILLFFKISTHCSADDLKK